MKKFTTQNLDRQLNDALEDKEFVSVLNAVVHFLRSGGRKYAPLRLDALIDTLKQNPDLARKFSQRFYIWLEKVHVYPALIKLGLFSRDSFIREISSRIYERFSPSYKDFNNLLEVLLYLFYTQNDEKWLQVLSLRQWLDLYGLIEEHADPTLLQIVRRKLTDSLLRSMEMLSLWIASEAIEPELVRIAPRLLHADSSFVALQREMAKLIEHYRYETEPYDTAHLEVMFDQCRTQMDYLARRGTGAGSGSSIKVAHLLERLQQTLGRLKLLTDIQTQPHQRMRLTALLMHYLINAAVGQYSTRELRRRSIRMLARSITENTSNRGEHYITRDRKEYMGMFYSAAGGGVIIALMALNKIHIGTLGYGEFLTSLLSGLNYGIGFMIIHMLHFTVATKQPAMTAARIAEKVDLNERGRAVDNKLAKLLIDVCRSQSVAVFGNVVVAVLLAGVISAVFMSSNSRPLLSVQSVAYQLQSIDIFTQPTLWYAAIAGVWLFCSGIIAGFFDNRSDYLDLRNRLTVNPFLRRIMPAALRTRLAGYMHNHYGSLMGNFIFGMLLGMTGFFGHLFNLPLDIRHVAFSSANLGYAAVSGDISPAAFIYGMIGVLSIGCVNLIVSFVLALYVALRSRGTQIGSLPNLFKNVWTQVKSNPLQLVYPVNMTPNAKDGGEQKPN